MAFLKFSNWEQPSNKKWKLVADILLYVLPLYSVAITAIVSGEIAAVVNTVTTCLVITLKAITKFTAEEPVV
jgi:hypothetical protein